MFNTFAHAAIDSVQTGKKAFVDTFVKHEGIAKTLNTFVDAQTAYTKAALDASINTATTLGTILTSKNFYDEITSSVKSFVPSSNKKTK